MKHIIKKANEIREKYGIDDLELLASKPGVEVVELPILALIDSNMAVEGATIHFKNENCDYYDCAMYKLCHPELEDGEAVVIEKVIGDSPTECKKGRSVKLVELARKYEDGKKLSKIFKFFVS